MASDRTATKNLLWMEQYGDPRALAVCVTCGADMAVNPRMAVWHAARTGGCVRWAQASHTVPGADGGRTVALECDDCNEPRGAVAWTPPQGTPTRKIAKGTKAHDAATDAIRHATEMLWR